jgi:hypothetical protein
VSAGVRAVISDVPAVHDNLQTGNVSGEKVTRSPVVQ